MNIEQVKEIANAVLYEGYLLYPYRHSAIKNRQRWTFGVVYPREYCEANGTIEPWTMRTECLVAGQSGTRLDVYVRFLHLLIRKLGQPENAKAPSQTQHEVAGASSWSIASRLANEPVEEGVEREVNTLGISLDDLVANPLHVEIAFPGVHLVEHSAEAPTTEIVREQQPIAGTVVISAEAVDTNLYKLSIQIENTTLETCTVSNRHNAVLRQSFVSTHTILHVQQGSFISLIDPPSELQAIAQQCQNLRTWPVLVGNEGEHDTILSSPIILYDYPQIAPESPGALFDGTEIDEILTLRILTLTEEEKAAMRQEDERVREILERTEHLTPEDLMKLHGTIRSLRPIDEEA